MRLAPVDRADADAVASALLWPSSSAAVPWDVARMPVNEWKAVLLHHPRLVEAWWPLTRFMVAGTVLPVRLRELAVLRVSHVCRSPFSWATHSVMAEGLGLSPADIERVRCPPDMSTNLSNPEDRAPEPGQTTHGTGIGEVLGSEWTPVEAAVLRAVDELVADARVSDETWKCLAAELDEPQLLELLVAVGQYVMLAYLLNSLGVEVEPEGVR